MLLRDCVQVWVSKFDYDKVNVYLLWGMTELVAFDPIVNDMEFIKEYAIWSEPENVGIVALFNKQ